MDIQLLAPTIASARNTSSGNNMCKVYTDATLEVLLYSVGMYIILLTSVVGNSVVLLSVLLSPTLKHRSTFHFAASLAASDMLWALCQIPIRVSVKLHGMHFCFGLVLCYIRMMVDVLSNVASILNLFFISIDRFVAVQMPYRYIITFSPGRAKRVVIGIWITSALWSVSSIFNWKHAEIIGLLSIHVRGMCQNSNSLFYVVSFLGIYIPVLAIISCTYARILTVAVIQIRKIQKHISVHKTMRATYSNESESASKYQPRRRGSLMKELKATKSIAIVYLAFCICWLPSCVMFNLFTFQRKAIKMNREVFQQVWLVFFDILPIMTTMLNPIIYSFSNSQFRKAVQYVWRKLWRNPQIRDSSFLSTMRSTTRMSYSVSPPAVSMSAVSAADAIDTGKNEESSPTDIKGAVVQMQLEI